jgi:CitMHS family citrate-Mg2+:H+ or citrate-Ca2+:H+ symporter
MHMRKTSLLRIAVLAMGVLNLMPWAGPTMRAASVMGMEAGALWGKLLPIQIFGIVLAMGVLNLMPWAGPTMRAASVLGIEAGQLWKTILPIQIFGIILALAHAVLAGWQEKKRGAGLNGTLAQAEGTVELEETAAQATEVNELARPKLFIFNICLTLAIIAMLIWDVFPSYYCFMIGVAVALFVNYGFTAKMHKKIINLHAGPALMMCSTLMGAAVLMGILTSSMGADGKVISAKVMELPEDALPSVVRCLANIVAAGLPAALGRNLPLVIGILSVPLALAFDTDSYFYGMLPVMIGIGQAFGVEALPLAVAMVVCRNCATFISPMVPATLLGIGLADIDIKDHIKATFLYVWVFSILCMIVAAIFGIMPL